MNCAKCRLMEWHRKGKNESYFKTILRYHFFVKGYSVSRLAKESGVSGQAIHKMCKKYGIKPRIESTKYEAM